MSKGSSPSRSHIKTSCAKLGTILVPTLSLLFPRSRPGVHGSLPPPTLLDRRFDSPCRRFRTPHLFTRNTWDLFVVTCSFVFGMGTPRIQNTLTHLFVCYLWNHKIKRSTTLLGVSKSFFRGTTTPQSYILPPRCFGSDLSTVTSLVFLLLYSVYLLKDPLCFYFFTRYTYWKTPFSRVRHPTGPTVGTPPDKNHSSSCRNDLYSPSTTETCESKDFRRT